MKQIPVVLFLVSFAIAAAAAVQRSFFISIPLDTVQTIKADTIKIENDSLQWDSLKLSLKKIPKAQHLYTVAKKSLGRWAKLFVVIKIEESGADGKNSYLAKKFNNLTGMRYPGKGRKTTSTGATTGYYAVFNSWYDCMKDFGYYIEIMESKFVEKYQRVPKDEYEMVNFMFGSFNHHQKWKNDVEWLLNHFNYK